MRESERAEAVGRTGAQKGREELVQCPVCDTYLKKNEGFTCPRCKKGPLCRSHRVHGKRECSSCIFDLQTEELGNLKKQEESLRSFLSFLQFLFIVFAIIFIAIRSGVAETIEFLQQSSIHESLELIGGVSVAGYILFYFILYNQKQRIRGLESELSESRFRRYTR